MADQLERCPTGINGFDVLISGGFPRARTILVLGGCGTGKTAFGIEFIYNGAVKYNEAGIFVALEQNPRLLRMDVFGMGYDLEKAEKDGKLRVIDGSLSRRGPEAIIKSRGSTGELPTVVLPERFKIDDVSKKILEVAKQVNAKRVVIDSISSISEIMCGGSDVRSTLLELHYALQDAELTSLMILDTVEEESITARGVVEEFIADGVIVLKTNEALNTRTLRIKKLRGTKHTLKPNTFELTSSGMRVG
jgi:KaiC/GvpD/RAD55 family RecA-like ATPase